MSAPGTCGAHCGHLWRSLLGEWVQLAGVWVTASCLGGILGSSAQRSRGAGVTDLWNDLGEDDAMGWGLGHEGAHGMAAKGQEAQSCRQRWPEM